MTRNVIGDFRERRWFYFFFPLNLGYLWGLGGRYIYLPFLSLLPTALESTHHPLALLVPRRDLQIIYHEIGRAPLFCRLLLPLSGIAHVRYASKSQRTTQKKSKWLAFQILFRWAKLDARFSPYTIFNPSIEKKNRKRPFYALSQTPVSFRPHYSDLLLYFPTHPGP